MKKYLLSLLFIIMSFLAFAQEEVQHHRVRVGETVYSIARQYEMSEEQFYELNPETRNLLREGQMVKVFAEKPPQDKRDTTRFFYHEVEPGETIYSLTRRYDVSESILLENNPDLKTGLKYGQTLVIPRYPKRSPLDERKVKESLASDEDDGAYHEVEAGETLYAITRKYGITANELVRANPSLSDGLKAGQRLKIPGLNKQKIEEKEEKIEEQVEEVLDANQPDSVRQAFTLYRIKEGDKVRDILKKYNLSREELRQFNPRLDEGMIPGRMLLIPLKKSRLERQEEETVWQDLGRYYPQQDTLVVVALIPLSIDEYKESDLVDSVYSLSRENRIGIDFYTGLKMAADSLVKKGEKIELRIYDLGNTEQAISKLLQSDSLTDADIIIGPFHAARIKELAEKGVKNKLIVSPLSREKSIAEIEGVYNCMPSNTSEIAEMARMTYALYKNEEDSILLLYDKAVSAEVKKAENFRKSLREIGFKGHISERNVEGVESYFRQKNAEHNKGVILLGTDPYFLTESVSALASHADKNFRVIGEAAVLKVPTIEKRHLGKLRFTRIEPFYIRLYDQEVASLFRKYREQYENDPTPFALQGFDVGYYFMREVLGRANSDEKWLGTQTAFHFDQQTSDKNRANTHFYWIELDKKLKQHLLTESW